MIVNHLRSLSGIDGTDGARIRAKRRAQAEFLASLIQSHQATEAVVSVGDYNAYPIQRRLRRRRRHHQRPAGAGRPGRARQPGSRRSRSDEPGRHAGAVAAVLVRVRRQRAGSGPRPRERASRSKRFTPGRLRPQSTPTSRNRCAAMPPRPERVSDHDAVLAYFVFPTAPVVTLVGASTLDVEAYTSPSPIRAPPHTTRRARCRSRSRAASTSTLPGTTRSPTAPPTGIFTTDVTRTVRVRDSDRADHRDLPGHAGPAVAGRSPARGRAARLCGHRCERNSVRAVPPCRATSRRTSRATATRRSTGSLSTRRTCSCAPNAPGAGADGPTP